MALAWPPTLGEPGMGEAEEFYLVVQNVSETAVRLAAGDDAPNPRRLMMWVQQKGLLRKLDFSKIAEVEETRYEGDEAAEAPIPADVREAVRAALAVPEVTTHIEKPLPPAATPPPATPAQTRSRKTRMRDQARIPSRVLERHAQW